MAIGSYFCQMKLLISFLMLSLVFPASAQLTRPDSLRSERQSIWSDLKYDGKTIVGGIVHAYSAPAHWKKGNWEAAAGISLGTMMLWASDEETSTFMRREGAKVPGVIQETGFRFGKPLINYGLTGGIYVVGLVTRDEKIRKTGVLMISSATAMGALQTILKNAAGRARPSAEMGAATFRPFSSEERFHSFPSGHAILAFTTAYALSKQFENPWVKTGILTLGMLTPVSRVWAGAHWASDVGVGIALSIVTVESIDRYLNKAGYLKTDPTKKKISWNLNFSRQTIGLTGTF